MGMNEDNNAQYWEQRTRAEFDTHHALDEARDTVLKRIMEEIHTAHGAGSLDEPLCFDFAGFADDMNALEDAVRSYVPIQEWDDSWENRVKWKRL